MRTAYDLARERVAARAQGGGDAPPTDAPLARARASAAALLPRLAASFSVIAAQTKSENAAQIWIDTWARHIRANALTDRELATGLNEIGRVLIAAGNPPFSFPLFLSACRPNGHLSGADFQSRQTPSLSISRDLTKDSAWREARDKAISRLREMGYCQKS